jgi:hypothetical protein
LPGSTTTNPSWAVASQTRSALSAELGKMQREGLLEFRKNHFHLYEEVRSL